MERDEVKQKLRLSEAAEQRAKQQLLDERGKDATKNLKELEEIKTEAKENEEMWKEKLMETEKVQQQQSVETRIVVTDLQWNLSIHWDRSKCLYFRGSYVS